MNSGSNNLSHNSSSPSPEGIQGQQENVIARQKTTPHHHHHHHHHHGNAGGKLGIAFLLNLLFAVIELIGGILTGSLAIISDAFHDLGDCLAIGIAWALEKKSKTRSSESFSYGLRRLSLVSAFLTGTILVVGALLVIAHAIPKLSSPIMPETNGMIGLALLGIFVNGAAAYKLMKSTSLNERMVYLHLLEDVLGWVAVLVGAIIMKFKPWPLIDPLLAIGISLWVLWNAVQNLKQTIQIFLQGSPLQIQPKDVENYIKEQQRVVGIHHTHIWSLDGEHHILTTHIQVKPETSLAEAHEMKTAIKRSLFDRFHIQEATIEIEWPDQVCEDPHH